MKSLRAVLLVMCGLLVGCESSATNSTNGSPNKKPSNPALTKQLSHAVMMGDEAEASRLIAAGADVDAGESEDLTPLHAAVFGGHQAIVKRLLAAGANIDTATSKGVTPLMAAVLFEQPEIADLLIDKGANLNARNSAGTSILILAVTMKHEDIARRLIEKGADVNLQTGGHETTALMMAAHDDLVETAKLLVAKGASPTVKDAHGKSAMDYAKSDAMKGVLAGGK